MKRIYPWLLAGAISLVGLVPGAIALQTAATPADGIEGIVFILNIALTACIGALIEVRQAGNRIGRLMLVVALATALPAVYYPAYFGAAYPAPPAALTPGTWLQLWLQGWFWLIQVVAIFQIALRFPDGNPPSARWGWLNTVSWAAIITAALLAMFAEQIGPIDRTWELSNPVGFLSRSVADGLSLIWVLGLAALVIGGMAALVQRFRGGSAVVRQQIKWLLYAGGLLASVFVVGMVYFSLYNASPGWLDVLFQVVSMALPLAIGNAILRYRLYDIDIIVRRTLSYSILTAVLGLVYFGGVILLQNVFGALFGSADSPLVTVLSTLAIAALFNPLRIRIQAFIDRRFYRKKYDAEQALAGFARVARGEVDLDRMSGELVRVVQETMQPDQVSLLIRQEQPGGEGHA